MKINNPMFNEEYRKNYYMAIHNPEYIQKKREMTLGEKNPNFGNHWTEKMKKELSEKKKGLKAFNNGEICIMRKECPEGFVRGFIKKK